MQAIRREQKIFTTVLISRHDKILQWKLILEGPMSRLYDDMKFAWRTKTKKKKKVKGSHIVNGPKMSDFPQIEKETPHKKNQKKQQPSFDRTYCKYQKNNGQRSTKFLRY